MQMEYFKRHVCQRRETIKFSCTLSNKAIPVLPKFKTPSDITREEKVKLLRIIKNLTKPRWYLLKSKSSLKDKTSL